jgi:hypothetical protein
MMNMVIDNRITETPELTGQFMVFPKSFGSEDAAQKSLSRMSREQLAAFLNAESGNARSAHFSAPPAESTPPTAEKGLAIGVLKQAAYDLRRYRTATKAVHRELYLDAHSWVTAYDSSWPYSFMNVCKLLDLCPEMVRTDLLADASLGSFHYWIRRAGRLSRKLSASVARVLDSRRSSEAAEGNQFAASV